MSWALIFKACLILAPVPVCWVLYRYLRASAASLEGTFFERLHVQASGPLAVYILVFASTSYLVAPDIISDRSPLTSSAWCYSFAFSPTDQGEETACQGELRIEPGPSGTVTVRSQPANDVIGEDGLLSERWFYFRIGERYGQRLVVFADVGMDFASIALPIYRLPHGLNKPAAAGSEATAGGAALERVGTLSLERLWPFQLLAYVVFLPLLVVYLLSRIGPPLVARIRGKDLSPPVWKALPISRIRFELTGAAAAYTIVLFIVGWISQHPPRNWEQQEQRAEAICDRYLAGEWYFELYSEVNRKLRRFDAVGRVEVDCAAGRGVVMLRNGIGNNPSKAFEAGHGCYRQQYAQKHVSFAWRSLIAAIRGDQLEAIYKAGSGEDTGVLSGAVRPDVINLRFYDFKVRDQHPKARSRGHIKFLRPDNPALTDCEDLRQIWLARCRKIGDACDS